MFFTPFLYHKVKEVFIGTPYSFAFAASVNSKNLKPLYQVLSLTKFSRKS